MYLILPSGFHVTSNIDIHNYLLKNTFIEGNNHLFISHFIDLKRTLTWMCENEKTYPCQASSCDVFVVYTDTLNMTVYKNVHFVSGFSGPSNQMTPDRSHRLICRALCLVNKSNDFFL